MRTEVFLCPKIRSQIKGVFQGPYKVVGRGGYTVWYYFDPRGYVHKESPSSEVELDMDLMNLIKPKEVGVYSVTERSMRVNRKIGFREFGIRLTKKKPERR